MPKTSKFLCCFSLYFALVPDSSTHFSPSCRTIHCARRNGAGARERKGTCLQHLHLLLVPTTIFRACGFAKKKR